jgi:hypothetical protein
MCYLNEKKENKMKIIITENQFNILSEQNLKEFLYKFWDSQKRQDEEPSLDDIIFQVADITKNSTEDHRSIRPIWYEYNGGYDKLLKKIDEEFLDKKFYLEGRENLKMDFKVNNIESYGVDVYGGMVDVGCRILGGTVDGYVYNEETEESEMVPNMDIRDQYAELEYDTGDFEDFLKSEIYKFLDNKFEIYGVPFYIEIN